MCFAGGEVSDGLEKCRLRLDTSKRNQMLEVIDTVCNETKFLKAKLT